MPRDAKWVNDNAAAQPGELKYVQLRRMQQLATMLLLAMLVLLLFSASYQAIYPWLQWVRAFAEAIGGQRLRQRARRESCA